MSIKKTPVCPFCHTDMQKEPLRSIRSDGAIIVTAYSEADERPTKAFHIDSYVTLQMYVCPQCRFVAFWQGEV